MRKVDFDHIGKAFGTDVRKITDYVYECEQVFSKKAHYISLGYEYAIIALHKAFESFVRRLIVGCINHDTSQVCKTYGISFGKHISDEMCDFILTKGGFFDIHGPDDLVKLCKNHVTNSKALTEAVRKKRDTVEQLLAFRNLAAHGSPQAKKRVKKLLNRTRIQDAGTYLKKKGRFATLRDTLSNLANDMVDAAKL